MKFSTIVLTTALLAGNSLAAPNGRLAQRIKARAGGRTHLSHPVEKVGSNELKSAQNSTISHAEYSTNWAGAVLENPPSPQATFTAVTGTFTVPEPTSAGGSQNGNSYQAASAWVGIDGDTYGNAILQTGVDITLQNGKASYDAWYEWYPDYAYDFDNINIQAGDVIVAYIKSTDNSNGVAVIENKSSGQSVTKTLSAPEPTATLGGQNAEWIVEDFQSGSSLVPLVDFGEVTFTGAVAETIQGAVGLEGAAVLDIRQSGKVYTDVTIESDSELVITYV